MPSPDDDDFIPSLGDLFGMGFTRPVPFDPISKDILQPMGAPMGGGMKAPPKTVAGTLAGAVKPAVSMLPSSGSLNLPRAPSVEDMVRASRIETVPLSQARGTQPKMQWDRFDRGDYGAPIVKGYENMPVAVRREDGEYLIFDGHHRAVRALQEGQQTIPMHVIDAKDYAPEAAGRRPAPPSISDDDLLKALTGGN